MGDGGLALRAVDLRVQVAEAAGGRVGEPQQRLRVQRGHLQVVVQRAVLEVVCDEEELREGARALDVRRDEACRRKTGSPLIKRVKPKVRLRVRGRNTERSALFVNLFPSNLRSCDSLMCLFKAVWNGF